MNLLRASSGAPDDLNLTAVALAREAGERRAELESERRIPLDLFQRAGEAGLYRQMVPVDRGGLGRTPAEWFRTGIEMARYEASFAWIVSQGSGDQVTFLTSGSRSFGDTFLADPCAYTASPDSCPASSSAPATGSLSDHWGFCSGAHDATWVGGDATVGDGPDAEHQIALVPVSRARIEDTWDVIGMIGTGSHTIVIDNEFVPEDWTFHIDLPAPEKHGESRRDPQRLLADRRRGRRDAARNRPDGARRGGRTPDAEAVAVTVAVQGLHVLSRRPVTEDVRNRRTGRARSSRLCPNRGPEQGPMSR